MCHLTLQYIDWLALQLLPDTAETERLDRHGAIWLVNSDGTIGRKQATFASGSATFTGVDGAVVPIGTQLTGNVGYETTADITIGTGPSEALVRALDPGSDGNLDQDSPSLAMSVAGVDGIATVVEMTGGVDTESDDDLRARILHRIQNPPMGVARSRTMSHGRWQVPGVTRAWAAPEQGVGTIMRASDAGRAARRRRRLAAATGRAGGRRLHRQDAPGHRGLATLAPIKQFIDVSIANLVPSTMAAAGAIEVSIREMLHEMASPGQTIYAAWVSYAIMNAPGVTSFHLLTTDDYVMPSLGHMAVLGTILYDVPPAT